MQEAVCATAEAIIFGPQRFIDRTFDDALSLLEEVRSYILYEERSDRMDLPPAARVRQSLEATRMTARLTNVMALAATAKGRRRWRNRRARILETCKPSWRSLYLYG